MQFILNRDDDKLIFDLIRFASNLLLHRATSGLDTYYLHYPKCSKSYEITSSMVSLHFLCNSCVYVENLELLFSDFNILLGTPLTLVKGRKSVTFLPNHFINVKTPKVSKDIYCPNPDSFSALLHYLQ